MPSRAKDIHLSARIYEKNHLFITVKNNYKFYLLWCFSDIVYQDNVDVLHDCWDVGQFIPSKETENNEAK